MLEDDEALKLYGTTQAIVPVRRLAAGGLSCSLCDGELRDVRWHGIEIARGVSYLLRDRDWGTVPARCGEPAIAESAEAFSVRYELQMSTPAGTLNADARLEGRSDGTLVFEVVATPDATIETNRCGFVVLHPASAAGLALQVEHTDGRTEATRFPLEISPSQPVFDIRQLRYAPAEGVQLTCRLEAQLPGDPAGKFEMEDQRNWSDASFKTYVASLLDPWPYRLPAEKAMTQRITLTARGRPPAGPAERSTRPIAFGATGARRMPEIGVGVPPGVHAARQREHAALRELGAGWWIVEAALDDPLTPRDLETVAALRVGLPVRVQLDMIVPADSTPDAAAAAAARTCLEAGLEADAVRLLPEPYLQSFQPTDRWPDLPPLEEYADAAGRHFARSLIGGGMVTCFTELNRKRQRSEGLDFIGHATYPIVHAPDDVSVMQTLEALPHIVRSVHQLWPGLRYRLGPSSIAMRRNPYGEKPASNGRRERIALTDADPRHDALFGAAWTVGYASAVTSMDLDVLALHASHGPSGPMGATEAMVPAWGVLGRLTGAGGARLVPLLNLPAGVVGLAWCCSGDAIEGLVANLTAEHHPLTWEVPIASNGGEVSTSMVLGPFEALRFAFSRPALPRASA